MIVLKWYLLVGLLFSTGLITLAIAAGKMDWIQKEFKLDEHAESVSISCVDRRYAILAVPDDQLS